MTQRGRRSAAELTTITAAGVTSTRRLPAPPDLTEEQAAVWRSIANASPAGWFGPGSAPVLAQLCRHVIAAERIASWLARMEADGTLDPDHWLRLLAAQQAETKCIKALATSLRLTPQSSYGPRAASTAARQPAADARRPWEI
jgi:hypothetical protein